MPDRILLTGAGGFVAGSILHHAVNVPELHAVSRGEARLARANLHWHQIDVRDAHALKQLFDTVRPQAVIHTAAIADIDFSEANQETAHEMNTVVTRNIAGLCHEYGAKLVHCSTDNVYDGERGRYNESDTLCSVNYYGETKIAAERGVRDATENAVIARVALVMGLPVIGAGNSFLARMIASWREGKEVGVPDEEIRSPIDVITLGRALLELAGNGFTGNIQLAGSDIMNRHEMAQRIAARLGFSSDLAVAKNPSNIPGRAPRPRDVSLDNALAGHTLATPMLGLEAALDLVLAIDKEIHA